MFFDVDLGKRSFITDEKEFRDSYYKEFLDIAEQSLKQLDMDDEDDSNFYYN